MKNSEKNFQPKKEKTKINSVTNALMILDILGRNSKGMLIKELSIELKFNLSTTYHLVNTLIESDYIQKVNNERYILGSKIPFLNNSFLQSIGPTYNLSSYLEILSQRTGETAYLGIEHNSQVLIQDIFESPQAVRVRSLHLGYNEHPHARALPKSIMAFWPEEKVIQFFEGRDMEKLTENTPNNIDQLLMELKDIRRDGYSLDEESFIPGISCVAAPVFGAQGKVAASLCVTVPSERYRNKSDVLIDSVCTIAEEASKSLGFKLYTI
ncbi:IclR family transcriptional regulator [Alteribacillus sp. JSM 102045]|uniref:IclR family transcriptional regulator n=1 Tax=Alteribacillus sp. JSM 102045 TaxID=1562101 RepID=UPI0035BEBDD7